MNRRTCILAVHLLCAAASSGALCDHFCITFKSAPLYCNLKTICVAVAVSEMRCLTTPHSRYTNHGNHSTSWCIDLLVNLSHKIFVTDLDSVCIYICRQLSACNN